MTNYVLKDNNNGYLKEFDSEFKRGELTVMTTDINKAYVFDTDSEEYKDNIILFTDLSIYPVSVEFEGIEQRVTHLKATDKTINKHYTQLAIQPFEYSYKNKLDALQHTIIKYVTRFREKGGLRDLQAAKVTLDILIQFEYIDKQ